MSISQQTAHCALGIDLGTQSVKALLVDIDTAEVCYSDNVTLELTQDSTGRAEQNAIDWTAATTQLLQSIPQPLKHSIGAISVSGQQHGFVPIDSDGSVLAPVKLWCDTSTQAQCNEITQAVGGKEACIELAGNPILVGYTASKILAFKQSKPDAYQRMAAVLLPHDYLNYWLTGEICMEMGDASGTGLLDTRRRRWCSQLIENIDDSGHLAKCLPEIVGHRSVIGYVTNEIAALTGLKTGIPVACGGGDNMMAAIGTGAVSDGSMTVSLGTSGTLFGYSDTPIVDPKGEIASFCSSNGGWLPLLCTMACTTTTELYRHLVNAPLSKLDAMLRTSEPGAQGLITLPFFNGERVPNLPDGKGVLMGMTANNLTPDNLLRSGVEGVTFGLYNGFKNLRSLGLLADEITLTGGGANSSAWRQLLADVFDCQVTLLNNNEGAAMGAAIQAASVCNNAGVVDQQYVNHFLKPETGTRILPNQEAHQQYQAAFDVYQKALSQVQIFYGPTH